MMEADAYTMAFWVIPYWMMFMFTYTLFILSKMHLEMSITRYFPYPNAQFTAVNMYNLTYTYTKYECMQSFILYTLFIFTYLFI